MVPLPGACSILHHTINGSGKYTAKKAITSQYRQVCGLSIWCYDKETLEKYTHSKQDKADRCKGSRQLRFCRPNGVMCTRFYCINERQAYKTTIQLRNRVC